MCAFAPRTPRIAASRSCVNAPIVSPVFTILNAFRGDANVANTSVVVIGIDTKARVVHLNDSGIKSLFQQHRDGNAMDYIIGVEIYDHLEKVMDRFEDVANRISGIVIEQV